MKPFLIVFALVISLSGLKQSFAQNANSQAAFNQLVKKTYNFDVLKLSNQQKMAKSASLDRFWSMVKAKPKVYTPWLREAIKAPKANEFFRFDGVNLLVDASPSLESKTLQVQVFTNLNFEISGTYRWVGVLCQRGVEGFDISAAATRWLTNGKQSYIIPEHGDYEVGPYEGSLLLFGSMDESKATSALLKIVQQPKHPARNMALAILMQQATPQSLAALQKLDMSSFAQETQQSVQEFLEHPQMFEPRANPKTSRAEFLRAFEAILKGDSSQFFALVDEVEDGERDVVAVMKPEDIPLIRKVRRRFTLGVNQHSLSYYKSFTGILLTLISKDKVKIAAAKPQKS